MKIPECITKELDRPAILMLDPRTSRLDKVINGLAIAVFMILSLGLYALYVHKRLPEIEHEAKKYQADGWNVEY